MKKTTNAFKKMKKEFLESEKKFESNRIEHNNRFKSLEEEFKLQEKRIKSRLKSYSK